jgi:hypothetical protein
MNSRRISGPPDIVRGAYRAPGCDGTGLQTQSADGPAVANVGRPATPRLDGCRGPTGHIAGNSLPHLKHRGERWPSVLEWVDAIMPPGALRRPVVRLRRAEVGRALIVSMVLLGPCFPFVLLAAYRTRPC